MRRITASLIALAATTAVGVGATAALAAKTADVTGTTSCTPGVKAKLKAGVRNSLTEPTVPNALVKVQLDVDDRAAGTWTASVNGVAFQRVTTGTAANGWNSEFIAFVPNINGLETFAVTASATSGKTCTGSVTA